MGHRSEETSGKEDGRSRPDAYVIWKEGNKYVVRYNGAIGDNEAEPDKNEKLS